MRNRLLLGMVLAGLVGCSSDNTDEGTTPAPSGGMKPSESGEGTEPGGQGGGKEPGATGPGSIVDIAASNEDFETLVQAVTRAGLAETLSGDGPFTVFAPTDAAFEKLGVNLDDLSDEQLKQILLYHVVGAEVRAKDVPSDPPVADTLADLSVWFDTSDGVKVNQATVTSADIDADNGVIHVIDTVLLPPDIPTMAGIAGLDSLVAAAGEAHLVDALSGDGPFTVFAPTNDAFAALLDALGAESVADVDDATLSQTLLYHVVSGAIPSSGVADGVTVVPTLATNASEQNLTLLANRAEGKISLNQAEVVLADIKTTNGIVHVVDRVITVPTIVDMAQIGGLTSLIGAAQAASSDLDALLAGPGTFTVFAPTNDAFAAIEAPADPDVLRDVLLYHVLTSDPALLAADLIAGDVETALAGKTVEMATSPTITVNGANVILADIVASNGVVHLIDQVLLP